MNIRPVVALKDSAAQMLNNSSIVMTPKRLLASPSGDRMQSQHSGIKLGRPGGGKHQPHHSMSNSFYLDRSNPLDMSMRGTGMNFNI